jgi:mono/diheme cytochrome c family protein
MGIAAPALSATSTSGLAITFASTTPSVCTVNGTVLTLVAAGSCSVTANQAGDASFAPAAEVLRTFTVAAALPPVVVASAAAGKLLYAANSCGSCHGTPPSSLKVLNGANSPITISSAISGVGSMSSYSGKFSAQNLTDMAAYLATPTI